MANVRRLGEMRTIASTPAFVRAIAAAQFAVMRAADKVQSMFGPALGEPGDAAAGRGATSAMARAQIEIVRCTGYPFEPCTVGTCL